VRTQDYVAYAPVSLEPAPLDSEAWTRFLAGFVEAFPDLQLTVEDAVAEGDLVAQRVHYLHLHQTSVAARGRRLDEQLRALRLLTRNRDARSNAGYLAHVALIRRASGPSAIVAEPSRGPT
jgi:hypothetical protein